MLPRQLNFMVSDMQFFYTTEHVNNRYVIFSTNKCGLNEKAPQLNKSKIGTWSISRTKNLFKKATIFPIKYTHRGFSNQS